MPLSIIEVFVEPEQGELFISAQAPKGTEAESKPPFEYFGEEYFLHNFLPTFHLF